MKVPKLRFKDDDGREFPEWEKKTIEELVNSKIILKPLDGNHGELHPKSSDYVDIGIPFVMANDIRNNVVDLEGTKKISKAQADELQKGFSFEGDVLLTHKGSVGFVAIVPKLSTDYIMLTPQVTYYRVVNKQKLSNKFLANYFISPGFQKEFLLLSGGGTRAYLGITEQRNLKVHIPCILEQTKIASFLTAIDEKITQLTQKCDLLAQYKKGVMQHIFSQKLRFKDDDEREFPEWKEKELKDIAYINPKTHSLPDEFIYIDLESVEKGILLKETKITRDNAPSRAQRLLEKNDVLFQMVRPYQRNNLFFDRMGKYVASTGYAQIRANEDSRFLYHCLHLDNFISEVMNRCTGTSYPAINSNDLASIPLLVPSKPEQTKIAHFLTAIDDKITQAQTRLDAVKRYKKGLLQQMFV